MICIAVALKQCKANLIKIRYKHVMPINSLPSFCPHAFNFRATLLCVWGVFLGKIALLCVSKKFD